MSRKLFVTGTGTDIGKTHIAGLILKRLLESGASCGYYKLAMSGNERDAKGALIPGDALKVLTMARSSQNLDSACRFVYENAYSPHLAARVEGRLFDLNAALEGLRDVEKEFDYLIIEGAGGIICPLYSEGGRRLLQVDVVQELKLPSLLVADSGLGTINGVTLTAEALRARGLALKGIVLNRWQGGLLQEDNAAECEALAEAPIVARVPEGAAQIDADPATLLSLFEE